MHDFALYFDWEGNPITAMQWSTLFADERHIGEDEIGDVRVSTVYVGLDQGMGYALGTGPPLIFETMIFGGPEDLHTYRYATEREARAGHARVVARQRALVG